MLYNHAEILCAELPIYRSKENDMYLFHELNKQKAYIKIGFLLIDTENKLYKPVYKYC